jgi:hypothetical protein
LSTQRAPARHASETLTRDTDSAFLVEKSVVGPKSLECEVKKHSEIESLGLQNLESREQRMSKAYKGRGRYYI